MTFRDNVNHLVILLSRFNYMLVFGGHSGHRASYCEAFVDPQWLGSTKVSHTF